jgi:hypothetical protein
VVPVSRRFFEDSQSSPDAAAPLNIYSGLLINPTIMAACNKVTFASLFGILQAKVFRNK